MTYNRTFYFADKGVQRGVAFEFGKAFEDASLVSLNERLKAFSNIYKYYVAYRLIAEERARRDAAKAAVASGGK